MEKLRRYLMNPNLSELPGVNKGVCLSSDVAVLEAENVTRGLERDAALKSWEVELARADSLEARVRELEQTLFSAQQALLTEGQARNRVESALAASRGKLHEAEKALDEIVQGWQKVVVSKDAPGVQAFSDLIGRSAAALADIRKE